MVAVVWLMLWLAPVVLLLAFMGPQEVFAQLAVFFSQVALVSFAAALVPYESPLGIMAQERHDGVCYRAHDVPKRSGAQLKTRPSAYQRRNKRGISCRQPIGPW
jgi:hypothetical protein